jgi:zinc protease
MKLQTKNPQANEAKKIAIQTLNNFINNNIDEQKLQDGKDNIIGGFALQTASNANILTYLSIIGFYNLPLDYLDTFTDKIKDILCNVPYENNNTVSFVIILYFFALHLLR